MKSLWRFVFAAMSVLFSSHSVAGDFEVQLSSETAQITLHSDSSLIGWGGADFTLGFFYNDDNDYLGQAGLLQTRQASAQTPVTLGVGVRGYLGQLDAFDADISALAVGGEIRYTVPGTMPMSAYIQGMYAPKITSFSDSEDVSDITLGFQVEALPQTIAYTGYRRLDLNLKNGSEYRADDRHFHFGIRFTF